MPTGRFTRFLIFAIGALLVLGVVAVFAGPRLLSGAVETKLRDELTNRALPLRVGALELGRSESRLSEVCVEAPAPANGDLACAFGIEVRMDLVAAARGDVHVRQVNIERVTVDASSERGTLQELQASVDALLTQLRGEPREVTEGSGDREPRERRQRAALPESVRIGAIELNAAGQGQPVDSVTLTDVELSLPGGALPRLGRAIEDGQAPTLRASLDVSAPFVSAMGLHIPATLQLEATLSSVGEPEVSVRAPTEPFRYASGPLHGEPLQWSGVGFSAPDTAWVEGVALGDPEIAALDRVAVRVREVTTSIDDLYLASLQLTRPRLTLRLDESGTPDVAARLGLASDDDAADDDDEDGVDDDDEGAAEPDANNDEDGADDDEASESDNDGAGQPNTAGAWSDRRWFEQLPQQITITDGALTVIPASGDPVSARDLNLTYAVRVLNTQMDAHATLALLSGDDAAGEVDVTLVWDWAHSALELDVAIDALSLGTLAELASPVAPWLTLHGELNANTRFRQQEDRSIPSFTGNIAVTDLVVNAERGEGDEAHTVFEEDLRVPAASYTWQASKPRGEENLVFTQGDIEVGDARATLTPTLLDLRLHRRQIISGIDVVFSLPRQPAQTVLDAFPRALLGPVAEARMSGDVAWEFAFPIRWIEGEDGERVFDLDEPTIDEFHDEEVTLDFLPESVDVRRLNQAGRFVFRGPDDSINRTLEIPRPRGVDAEEGEETTGVPGWRRLEQISYFLIAAQLYREDGRFFTNRGINWYQMRLVAEEAARTGWFERGASTVSMQLVKNVFLTHERSIERKVQELFLTYWMTRTVPKERILEVYLNVIEWGPNINGVDEAANYYFGLAPSELNLAQSVWLAAITPAPRRRAAQRALGQAPEWQMNWVRSLMEGMADRNWITQAELSKGREQPVRFITSGLPVQPVPTATPGDPGYTTWQGPETGNDDPTIPGAAGGSPEGDVPIDPTIVARPDPTARTRALIYSSRSLR